MNIRAVQIIVTYRLLWTFGFMRCHKLGLGDNGKSYYMDKLS